MGANSIFCRSCGEQIKRDAEICPECGVRNTQSQARGGSRTSRSRGRAQATGGGRQTATGGNSTRQATGQANRTEPSDSWVYGVAAGGVLWLIVLFLQVRSMVAVSQAMSIGGPAPSGSIVTGLGAAFLQSPSLLIAWIVLPLSMYFDSKYVAMNSDLDVSKGLYVGFPVIAPVFNTILFVVGILAGVNPIFAALIPLLVVALTGYYLKQRQDAL